MGSWIRPAANYASRASLEGDPPPCDVAVIRSFGFQRFGFRTWNDTNDDTCLNRSTLNVRIMYICNFSCLVYFRCVLSTRPPDTHFHPSLSIRPLIHPSIHPYIHPPATYLPVTAVNIFFYIPISAATNRHHRLTRTLYLSYIHGNRFLLLRCCCTATGSNSCVVQWFNISSIRSKKKSGSSLAPACLLL